MGREDAVAAWIDPFQLLIRGINETWQDPAEAKQWLGDRNRFVKLVMLAATTALSGLEAERRDTTECRNAASKRELREDARTRVECLRPGNTIEWDPGNSRFERKRIVVPFPLQAGPTWELAFLSSQRCLSTVDLAVVQFQSQSAASFLELSRRVLAAREAQIVNPFGPFLKDSFGKLATTFVFQQAHRHDTVDSTGS